MNNSKGYKGMAMEGPIAAWYAKITQKDMQRHKQMARQLAQKIPAGSRVLEIAPGPGYFAIELARLGDYQITGLDISKSFVEIAQKNAAEAGVKAEFRQGNASDMPFADESFDFMFCQAAFKNFSQPIQSVAEMHRVLRAPGTAVIDDLRRDAPTDQIDTYVKGMGMGYLNRLITKWTFRNVLLKNAYTIAEMEAFVRQTPFGQCRVNCDEITFQVWLEKR
jgi:ubiquinone/menaquinone biosynthesis C-methylase UbiE